MLIFLPQEIAMNYKQLTSGERYQIKAYLKIGLAIKLTSTVNTLFWQLSLTGIPT